MTSQYTTNLYSDFYKMFVPTTPASKVLIPLLDALNWQGDNSKIVESLTLDYESMDLETLMETMANLKFEHIEIKNIQGKTLDVRSLPVLFETNDNLYLVINIDNHQGMVYDTNKSLYDNIDLEKLSGNMYCFSYAEEKRFTPSPAKQLVQ